MYRVGQEEIDAVTRVIESKKYFKVSRTGLQQTKLVEEELKEKFETKYAIHMTSGHAALVSALIGMGVGPGDEVIVPAYTYIATAMAVVAVGAIPVIAEVDETLTLDIEDVKKKITPRTKALLPVHIQGFPCNMDAIMEVAKEHDLFVLEDACQADGGAYHGKRLGTIGEAGALSFNLYKVISCGEGGALLTDDKKIFERAMIYHDSSAIAFFGDQLADNGTPVFCGQEFRCNEIPSSILRVQLTRLDGILSDLRAAKKKIMEELSDCFTFIPSHDIEGDCGTTLAIRFETEQEARRFAACEGVDGVLPIDTGKHVYSNWTPILEKRGAFHPLMDPFKMEANKPCDQDYRPDMCPKTLDLLARTVYISVNPDWTKAELQEMISTIRKAATIA